MPAQNNSSPLPATLPACWPAPAGPAKHPPIAAQPAAYNQLRRQHPPDVDGAYGCALLLGQGIHQLLLKRHIRLHALGNHLQGVVQEAGRCTVVGTDSSGAGCQQRQLSSVAPPPHLAGPCLQLHAFMHPHCMPPAPTHLLVDKQPGVVPLGGRLQLIPAADLVAGHAHQRVLAHQHLAVGGQGAAEVLQLLHGQALVAQAHHHRALGQQALQHLNSLLLALPGDGVLHLRRGGRHRRETAD